MASCQKWGIMRSFLNLQNLVIVSSLAFGLFTIRILAMDGLDSPDEDSSSDVDFPICNKKIIPGRELLLVSTLDGKLSAIDPKHGGSLWSVATGKMSFWLSQKKRNVYRQGINQYHEFFCLWKSQFLSMQFHKILWYFIFSFQRSWFNVIFNHPRHWNNRQ